MKKLALILAALFVAEISFAQSANRFLWKVSGNGVESPSYLFGTYHLAPASMIYSIAGLKDAIKSVDAIYGEVEKDALTSTKAQQAMMQYAIAPADSALSMILSPRQFAKVDSLFTLYTGKKGFVAQSQMFKPSMLTTQLAMLQIMKNFPNTNVAQSFDAELMSIGEREGKEIGGLETLEDQLKLLFGAPISEQAEDLMEAVDNNDKSIEQSKNLIHAYMAQNLDELTRISTDPEYGMTPEGLEKLIYKRNRNWATELAKILPTKSVLVAVGAGHLGGDQGLINLLRRQGYTVECVSK